MAIAAVVGHEIDQHPQAVVMGAGNERVRLLESAEVRMDIAIVADVVPTVGQRGRIPRANPERIDAELGEVGQSVDDAEDVSGAIVIVVGERPRIDLVNDGAAPPIGLTETGHARILGPAGRAKAGCALSLSKRLRQAQGASRGQVQHYSVAAAAQAAPVWSTIRLIPGLGPCRGRARRRKIRGWLAARPREPYDRSAPRAAAARSYLCFRSVQCAVWPGPPRYAAS